MMFAKSRFNVALAVAIAALVLSCSLAAHATTVAYWRFEEGPENALLPHSTGGGVFDGTIPDVSGNGNDLSAWSDNPDHSFYYRSEVPFATVPQTGAANNFSIKNAGGNPGLFTDSAASSPTGIDLETWTPTAWTVEASYKPQTNGYRSLLGRDAKDIAAADSNLAALYLQIQPDDRLGIKFVDMDGYFHEAYTAPGFIHGFDWGSDPEGLTGTWYNIAAVSDGVDLKLYVNGNLEGSTSISASGTTDARLAYGTTDGGDWHAGGWSVGRGLYGGGHGDRGYGYIDEVRISEGALAPNEFLGVGVPEPATGVLLLMASGLLFAVGRRQRG